MATSSLGEPRTGRHIVHRLSTVATSRSARTQLLVAHHRRMSDARGSLWFKPALAVLVALTAGAALSQVQVGPDSWLWKVSFRASANDARQVLTVIIGALIPVTSLVFALTVVTLQIASTQFSPRLLRTFLRDRGTQLVLSVFVGTVAFSLACLFTIDTGTSDPTPDVPRLAITVALVLALVCIGMLVFYFGHITNAVRIDTVMRQVEDDTRRTLEREHPLIRGTTTAGPVVLARSNDDCVARVAVDLPRSRRPAASATAWRCRTWPCRRRWSSSAH